MITVISYYYVICIIVGDFKLKTFLAKWQPIYSKLAIYKYLKNFMNTVRRCSLYNNNNNRRLLALCLINSA